MPNLDGTGPRGKGPRTGQGLGSCLSQQKNGAKSTSMPGRNARVRMSNHAPKSVQAEPYPDPRRSAMRNQGFGRRRANQ